MKEVQNPYQPATNSSELNSSARPSLGKPLSAVVGVFVCGAAAIVVGEVLSVIGLFPPLSHWIGFDTEFSGLILVGMPMLAGGTGALAGFVLGLVYPHSFCRMISAIIGSLPALYLCYANYGDENSRVSTMAVSGIMILSTVSGVFIARRVLERIERHRANQSQETDSSKPGAAGRIAMVLATSVAILSVSTDVWLWRVIETNENSGYEFTLILAFGLGVLAVATNVYVGAAYPHRKRIAIMSGLIAFGSFSAVLVFWYLRLIA